MKTKLALLALLALLIGVMLTGCVKPPPTITAITALYSDELKVEFHAYPYDESLTYVWDTGDGGRAVGQDHVYEYAAYGEYMVTVTARAGWGRSSEFTLLISVDRWRVCFDQYVRGEKTWACTFPEGGLVLPGGAE